MTKPENIFSVGGFRFNSEAEELIGSDGTKIALRPQTARVLGILVDAKSDLVTKDFLMRSVWADTHVTDDSLVQCISEIRRALGPEDAKLLATVPKQGYRLSTQPAPYPDNADQTAAQAVTGVPSAGRRIGPGGLLAFLAAFALIVGAAALFLTRDGRPKEQATLAILPFVNISGEAGQDYLSVGLAEDLLTDLSRNGGLIVLSRSATFAYRGAPDPASEVHKALGATHLIDGSLQREGDRIRISVQLVEAETGASVWAERFDRELGGLFELQDEVRSRIVSALSEEFRLEAAPASRPGTSEVTAYDLLLQGRFQEASLTQSGISRALEFYKRAVEVDPNYGDAYARLANMYDFSSRLGWSSSASKDRSFALQMAEKAVQLEPENPFAHWTHGRILSRRDSSEDSSIKALAALEKAIELDPNYADAYAFAALLHVGGGRTEKAREAMDTAFRLNLEPPSWYLRNRGIIAFFLEDYEAAISDFYESANHNPTDQFTRIWLAAALAQDGQIEDAEWEFEEARALGSPGTIGDLLQSNQIIRYPPFREAYAAGLRMAGVSD